MNRFVLASKSPRRSELLNAAGVSFDVIVSDADEKSISSEDVPVGIYVQELALIKAAATAKKVLKEKNTIIISADTVVTIDGEILGKPVDENDAFDMLMRLSGKKHEVYTGYCIMRIMDGYTVCNNVRTDVYFKELTEEKIQNYIKTGEPMDKAGSYGIQGVGGLLVDRINGDYANVVGLPVSALSDTLEKDFDISLI